MLNDLVFYLFQIIYKLIKISFILYNFCQVNVFPNVIQFGLISFQYCIHYGSIIITFSTSLTISCVISITTGLNKNCKTFIKSIKEWSQILLGLLNEAKMIFYEKRIELKNQKGSFFYNIK